MNICSQHSPLGTAESCIVIFPWAGTHLRLAPRGWGIPYLAFDVSSKKKSLLYAGNIHIYQVKVIFSIHQASLMTKNLISSFELIIIECLAAIYIWSLILLNQWLINYFFTLITKTFFSNSPCSSTRYCKCICMSVYERVQKKGLSSQMFLNNPQAL